MRKIFILSIVLFFSAVFPLKAQEKNSSYLGNIPDIPMMQGMVEEPEEGFVFDTPEGQVARATVFLPKKDEKDVLSYYTKALPELGWGTQKSGLFVRNGEQLTLTIEKFKGGVAVIFDLAPESD